MELDWNDAQPIYRQLRDRVVAMMLDGDLRDGDVLPSVRQVAADLRVNPLTVLKSYQGLVDEQLIEKRRGLGMFVRPGARQLLLQDERERFLNIEWPRVVETIQRLGLDPKVLLSAANNKPPREPRTMTCIEARGLRKHYGKSVALDGIDLRVDEGRIVGLIGPNGAGKSTALHAILGLTPYDGELRVLGHNPWADRDALMRDVCFIADVAVLPRWIKVSQALDYVAGVHPRFDRARAETLLARTSIRLDSKVKTLSKGMTVQLHLALVMAIDARLLVLDEPTLGLDLLYRKQFYDALLNEYFDGRRTILITTHQVEEIQDLLTDLIFIQHGRIVLDSSMDTIEQRYTEVMVRPEQTDAARALKPLRERRTFGRSVMLFDNVAARATAAARRSSAPPASPISSSPPWKNRKPAAR